MTDQAAIETVTTYLRLVEERGQSAPALYGLRSTVPLETGARQQPARDRGRCAKSRSGRDRRCQDHCDPCPDDETVLAVINIRTLERLHFGRPDREVLFPR